MNKFTAPETGIYQISSKVFKAKRTGKQILQPNVEWRWYKPWLPQFALKDEWITEVEYSGQELKYLKKDEVIVYPLHVHPTIIKVSQ